MATHGICVSRVKPTDQEEHILTQSINQLHVLSAGILSQELDELVTREELTRPEMIEYPLQSR